MDMNIKLHCKESFHSVKHTQGYEASMSFKAKTLHLPLGVMSKMFIIEENSLSPFGPQFLYL